MNDEFVGLLTDTLRQMLDSIDSTREVARGNERGMVALLRILAEKGIIDAADISAVDAAMAPEKDRPDGQ